MFKFEKKLIKFIENHLVILFIIIVTVLALIIRWPMLNNVSADWYYFLEPWSNAFRENGLAALATFAGDYNAPYITIMALLAQIPLPQEAYIYLLKAVSIIGEFLLAISSAILVKKILSKGDKKNHKNSSFYAAITYAIIILLPTVVMNGALWGQCDAIYASFVVLSLIFLIEEKYLPSFIMLGVAFAFKLQFIFILPLYVILYFSKKKFSFLYFLVIPIVNFILCIPAILLGWNISNLWGVYLLQASENPHLAISFPSIFYLIPGEYDDFSKYGIVLALIACGIALLYCMHFKIKWNSEKILNLALWSIVIVTFLLPAMHERYAFLAEILSIIILIAYRRNLPLVAFLLITAMINYSSFLFGAPVPDIAGKFAQSIIYIPILLYFTKDTMLLLREKT